MKFKKKEPKTLVYKITFVISVIFLLLISGGIKIELKFLKDKNMGQLLFKVYHLLNDFVIV